MSALLASALTSPFYSFTPYPWQSAVHQAFEEPVSEVLLIAGNRTGKTRTGAHWLTQHLTGQYAPWHKGERISYAPLVWALGKSYGQVKEVVQLALLGEMNEEGRFSGGLIRPDQIGPLWRMPGVVGVAGEAKIRHQSGQYSTLMLKAYSQGTGVLMGQAPDIVFVDEQPPDDILAQLRTRLMIRADGRPGLLLMTATLELGMTPLILSAIENPSSSQRVIQAQWSDAPHLTAAMQEELEAKLPDHERQMRRTGIPSAGMGAIYPVAESRFVIEPFSLAPTARGVVAMDLGWHHPTAAVLIWHDTDSDTMFVTAEYKRAREIPAVHTAAIRAWGKHLPVIVPHDFEQTEKGTGKTLGDTYREAGLNVVAVFSNPDGTRHVEPGIMEVLERLQTDRLKVFNTCRELLAELRLYRRDEVGRPIKANDDLMDALRYAVMSSRYAQPRLTSVPKGQRYDY